MLFLRKTDETIWKREPPPPPPPLSTNPSISEQFFMTLLCQNFKNENPPLILGEWGRNYKGMNKV